ncbi:MAG: ATP-grasp domain-containing protein [Gammaproteobacteria bacterium]|nr:ATP-grasp domain-containing protein [Gammaproteobacteria bacterium]MDH5729471.1 ATP-grasp domain-containing protein [Gammaproteobacteria bacterium]
MNLPYCLVFNHVGEASQKNKQFNLSTLAVVRSLGRRNVPVVLVTTNSSDAVISSKYTKHVEYCPYLHESEEKLLEFLLSLSEKYPGDTVLLPAVDECSYFVGKYHEQLSEKFLIPAPNWHAVKKINNKRFQYEAADSLGIPIPETYFPRTLDDVAELAKEISNYPYVIKPNVSFEWKLNAAKSSARGKKGIRVDNAEELLKCAEEVFVPEFEFMIQEVIGGRDERLVTFLGFLDENSEPDSYFIRKKMRQCPIDFGYCTLTESCHNPTVLDQSVRLLQLLKYHGIAGVEWKLDPATNTYKLIEINARPVNTTGCAIASGIDLPAIAYFHKIGKPLPSATEWEDGQRWAWLAMDFWAAKELIGEGKLTYRDWFRNARSIKADAIYASDDFNLSIRYYTKFVFNLFWRKLTSIFK